tara:strand:+ start:22365 stop:22550 length:186 start_codon:yes stop_codon:yes gene_type:complete
MGQLMDRWAEMKVLVESLELDMLKSSKGNKSAGVRARKGLRELKKQASELVKSSLESSKSN